jgi:hypothetical protein
VCTDYPRKHRGSIRSRIVTFVRQINGEKWIVLVADSLLGKFDVQNRPAVF